MWVCCLIWLKPKNAVCLYRPAIFKGALCNIFTACKQQNYNKGEMEKWKGCDAAAVLPDVCCSTDVIESVLWAELRRADTTLSEYEHTWLSAVPNLTPSDVIGDGGFVYHIWQHSDTARLGIGRERPSFTKVCLLELYKQSGGSWEL